MVASYAKMGKREEALKILGAMDREANPLDTSGAYFSLGDVDRGFEYLSKSMDRRQGPIRWLNVSPQYDGVRSDPRFAAVVARLKLPASPSSR